MLYVNLAHEIIYILVIFVKMKDIYNIVLEMIRRINASEIRISK